MKDEKKKIITEWIEIKGRDPKKDQRLNESDSSGGKTPDREVRKISGVEPWPDPPKDKDKK